MPGAAARRLLQPAPVTAQQAGNVNEQQLMQLQIPALFADTPGHRRLIRDDAVHLATHHRRHEGRIIHHPGQNRPAALPRSGRRAVRGALRTNRSRRYISGCRSSVGGSTTCSVRG